jgi:hypothetical protein
MGTCGNKVIIITNFHHDFIFASLLAGKSFPEKNPHKNYKEVKNEFFR